MGFEVREASYEDIPAIAQITYEAFLKYAELVGNNNIQALRETDEDIRKDIDTSIVLVAFMDGVPVGSVRVKVDKETNTAYLSRFGVKVSSQNNGIGKSLMNLVDIKMRELGIKQIMLHNLGGPWRKVVLTPTLGCRVLYMYTISNLFIVIFGFFPILFSC